MKSSIEEPRVELSSDPKSSELAFTLSNVDVSVANSLRRIILSDVPILVFKKASFLKNTCGLNNEIVNHRLKCIPIHIKHTKEFPLQKYILEVNVENHSDSNIFVTTKDFKLKELETGKYINEYDGHAIFPSCILTNQYIDFVRLKAKHSDQFPAKTIHLTCPLEISTAKEDSAYNVVSTCSYGNTIDESKQEEIIQQLKQKWKDEGKKEEEVAFEVKNWKLLEGKRVFKDHSFDFVVDSVSVYDNVELLILACEIMLRKLETFQQHVEKNKDTVKSANNTMQNCYDITLYGEDYTLGKVIEHYYLKNYFQPGTLSYCGFKKVHPHDHDSIIRVSYKATVDMSNVKNDLMQCITTATELYKNLHGQFRKWLK